MFVGSVERGCRTLAVGALEQPAWSLAPNWGEATNCSYSRLLPLLHRIEQSIAEQYSWERRTCNCWCTGSSRGGNGFGRGAGLRKVCSCEVFEEMVKSIGTRSRITWISCCLSCRPLCELGFPVCCSSFPGSGKEWKPLGRPSFSLPPLLKDKIDPTNTGLEFPITNG